MTDANTAVSPVCGLPSHAQPCHLNCPRVHSRYSCPFAAAWLAGPDGAGCAPWTQVFGKGLPCRTKETPVGDANRGQRYLGMAGMPWTRTPATLQ
eukprot:1145227-Pelagomonas_calceolata.AAC.2